jgi:hypothetical protein
MRKKNYFKRSMDRWTDGRDGHEKKEDQNFFKMDLVIW